MTLEDYLWESHCNRYNIPTKQMKSIDKNDYKEHIRNEYKYLRRRLSLLFGKEPDFLNAPNIEKIEERITGDTTKDNLFYVKEYEYIFSKNEILENIDQSDKSLREEINRIVAIFWYIVISFSNEKENSVQIEKGIKLLNETATRSFANSTQRRKMYNDYFGQAENSLSVILQCINDMDNYRLIPDFHFFKTKNIKKQHVLNYITSTPKLLDLKEKTEKALNAIMKSINKLDKNRNDIAYNGGIESVSKSYACDISPDEQELFDLLIQNIEENKKSVIDAIHNNDWSDIDKEVREKINELLWKIYDENNLKRINRYIRAKNRTNLIEELESIGEKLSPTAAYKFWSKYNQLFDLIYDNEINDGDLIECEKFINRAISIVKKYNKQKENDIKELQDQDYTDQIEETFNN